MGKYSQYLDTEITVELNLSDLDDVINKFSNDKYLSGFADEAKKLKKAWEKGTKDGVKEVARVNKSFQQQYIAKNCDNPSGMLMSSIEDRKQGDYHYLVGTILNHIYPMSVEYGRRGFSVKPPKKALAFYYKGELIFRKKVGKAEARPFVAPAYEDTKRIAEEIMLRKIGNAYNG